MFVLIAPGIGTGVSVGVNVGVDVPGTGVFVTVGGTGVGVLDVLPTHTLSMYIQADTLPPRGPNVYVFPFVTEPIAVTQYVPLLNEHPVPKAMLTAFSPHCKALPLFKV